MCISATFYTFVRYCSLYLKILGLLRHFNKPNYYCYNSKMGTYLDSSDLSYIEIKDISNPAKLLHDWVHEARTCGLNNLLMNVATATKTGKVNNRTVLVQDILPDASMTFFSQVKSNKIKEITENPQVAATVLLMYKNKDKNVTKQVRVMGLAEKLSQEQCKIYFENSTLAGKIRCWIGRDCKAVEWNDLKAKHDELLKEVVEKKKVLEMPETMVAYKIVPKEIEFYFSDGNKIGDRITFKLHDDKWHCQRIMS